MKQLFKDAENDYTIAASDKFLIMAEDPTAKSLNGKKLCNAKFSYDKLPLRRNVSQWCAQTFLKVPSELLLELQTAKVGAYSRSYIVECPVSVLKTHMSGVLES